LYNGDAGDKTVSITPTYPGVYIQELPSGVRTITGVSTSITAFVGRAKRGPIDKARLIHSFGEFESVFGGLWAESKMSYSVYQYFLNGGKDALIVRVYNKSQLAAASGETPALLNDGTAIFGVEVVDSSKVPTGNVLYFAAANPGAWGRNIEFKIEPYPASLISEIDPSDPTIFNITIELYDSPVLQILKPDGTPDLDAQGKPKIRKGNMLTTEKHRNLSLKSTSIRFVTKILKQDSQLLRVPEKIAGTTYTLPTITNALQASDFQSLNSSGGLIIQPIGFLKTGALNPVRFTDPITQNESAVDGLALAAANIKGNQDSKTGMYALENADLFNMLCIPPYNSNATDNASTGALYSDVYPAAVQYCTAKRAMLLVDPPSDWATEKDVTDESKGVDKPLLTRNANAALYFPNLTMSDPLKNGQLSEFVPCGAVAGVIATTDVQRGIWKAPAGIDAALNGVTDLTLKGNPMKLTDGENGELNPLGVNCLRIMPAVGPVVWGSRTMRGADRLADQWKYLPVRRIALYIEESLFRGTQWVVFEPNDEPLWSQIRLNITAFMQSLFLKGAFQGTTPKDAYFVKCDSETTTQTDINNGIVNIIVGFAPLKPAEFVILKIQQIADKGAS
jgi:phage tail sheath protein FI